MVMKAQPKYQVLARKDIDLKAYFQRPHSVPIVFVLGGPGAGKGTQCEHFAKKNGWTHLSSGDLLRAEVKTGSERGMRLKQLMDAGLPATEGLLNLLKEAMVKALKGGTNGFLIDGFPRELELATEFEDTIAQPKHVLFFAADDFTLLVRLLRRSMTSGRSDDNLGTILNRLNVFHTTTMPVVHYFAKQGKVVQIDASQSIGDVTTKFCECIEPFANRANQ